MQMRERHVGEERLAGRGLPLHEVYGARGKLGIDAPARCQIVNMHVFRRRALHAFHHVRNIDDRRIKARRTREHAFVGGARYAVPLVETAIFGKTSFAVAEVPLAVTRGGITATGDQLRKRDFPRDETLRQSRRYRLQRAGAYRVAACHQRRARRHAIGFDVEVETAQSFGREPVDARRRRTAQRTAAVAAEFAPAEIVGEDKDDVRQTRSARIGHGLLF